MKEEIGTKVPTEDEIRRIQMIEDALIDTLRKLAAKEKFTENDVTNACLRYAAFFAGYNNIEIPDDAILRIFHGGYEDGAKKKKEVLRSGDYAYA